MFAHVFDDFPKKVVEVLQQYCINNKIPLVISKPITHDNELQRDICSYTLKFIDAITHTDRDRVVRMMNTLNTNSKYKILLLQDHGNVNYKLNGKTVQRKVYDRLIYKFRGFH